ncbi:MAG: alcohol dehydrogenase catalytic domain-containing protein [Candidatus Bathyarchaeia archaeon]
MHNNGFEGSKLKAMVLREFKKPLKYENVPDPKLDVGEALVQIKACGICRTDIHIVEGLTKPRPNLPRIIGHEPAGIIVGLSNDTGGQISLGDRVVVSTYLTCGICYYCRTGRENLCVNLKGRIGFELDGGYAEYLKAPINNLFKIPEGLSFEEAAIAPDAAATTLHALRKRGEIKLGNYVAIIGVGGLGTIAIQIAKNSGAKVIAVDIRDERLKMAKDLGADFTINASSEDPSQQIIQLTEGLGADLIIENVGSSQSIHNSIFSVRRGGRIVIIGYGPELFTADPQKIALEEIEIVGSRACTRQELKEILTMMGEKSVKGIITEKFPLNEANQALKLLDDGKIMGRAVLIP